MLENAIYSVISPEGCATILWRDPKKMLDAAKAMKLSAKDLLDLEIIDEIIAEPIGGAHRDKDQVLLNVRETLSRNLEKFKNMSSDEIFNDRKSKFLKIGRKKGFIDNLEDLSSTKSKINTLDKIKDFKKYAIPISIFFVLALFLIYYL